MLCKIIENPSLLKRGQKLDDGIYILGASYSRCLTNDEVGALQQFLKHDPSGYLHKL